MLGWILWLVTSWAAGGASVTAGEAWFEPSADPAVRSAHRAFSERRWSDAIRELDALSAAGAGAEVEVPYGLALLEQGRMQRAEAVLARARSESPEHAALRVVHARVLADLGRGREALGLAELVDERAAPPLQAHARWVEAIVAEDAGAVGEAVRLLRDAERAARAGGQRDLAAEVEARREALEHGREDDPVGRVSRLLSDGRAEEASRWLARGGEGSTPRQAVQRAIAEAMVARGDRRLDRAGALLQEASGMAEDAGMLRERLVAMIERARVLSLRDRPADALRVLQEADRLVSHTSFAVRSAEVSVELAMALAKLGRSSEAAAALANAVEVGRDGERPALRARWLEANAWTHAALGRPERAYEQWEAALSVWASRGHHGEVARVALRQERLRVQHDLGVSAVDLEDRLARGGLVSAEAERLVAVALGHAEASRWHQALSALDRAGAAAGDDARLQERIDGWRGQIAARFGEEGAAGAAKVQAGIEARGLYRRGVEAFEEGRLGEALSRLGEAVERFRASGDASSLQTAKRARWAVGWARAEGRPSAEAVEALESLRDEAKAEGWLAEEIKAEVAAAVELARVGRGDAERLATAAERAKETGNDGARWRCLTALVSLKSASDAARLARHIDSHRGGQDGARALVDAAFVAWRSSEVGLAEALLAEAGDRPVGASASDAASLRSALDEAGIAPEAVAD